MLIWVAVGFLACVLAFLALAATAPMLANEHSEGDWPQQSPSGEGRPARSIDLEPDAEFISESKPLR